MSPAAEAVIQRLDATRQKWWLFTLLTTCALAGCVSLALILIFMLCDAFVTVGQTTLLVMSSVWLVVNVGLIAVVGRRSAQSQRSLEATARRIESEYPQLGSNLINLIQLSENVDDESRPFRHAAVDHTVANIGQTRFENAAAKESRRRRFVYRMQTPRDLAESSLLLCVLIAIAVYCHLSIPNLGSAASRLMTPWTFVPSVGTVEIEIITPQPHDTEVMMEAALEITAEIRTPAGELPVATLFVTPQGEAEKELPMALLQETSTRQTSAEQSDTATRAAEENDTGSDIDTGNDTDTDSDIVNDIGKQEKQQSAKRSARFTLTIPAIQHSRSSAYVAECKNNLREIGRDLADYSETHGGYFPQVPTKGKQAAAGIYAPILREANLLRDAKRIVCPGSSLAGRSPLKIPSLRELQTAS
ncbi:hypothetical protein LCGC14_2569690, partial [marine sediment metagenome]